MYPNRMGKLPCNAKKNRYKDIVPCKWHLLFVHVFVCFNILNNVAKWRKRNYSREYTYCGAGLTLSSQPGWTRLYFPLLCVSSIPCSRPLHPSCPYLDPPFPNTDDYCRVMLPQLNGADGTPQAGSDYINASYLNAGTDERCTIIAAQGP